MSRIPIRLRLTLAFALVSAIVLAALGSFVYSRFDSELSEQIDQSLRTHGDDIAALAAGGDLARNARLLGREESFAQVLTPNGRIYATTPQLGSNPQITPAEAAEAARSSFISTRPHVRSITGQARLLARPASGPGGERFVVVTAASLDDRNESLASLRTLLLIGGPVALLLASLAGYAVSGRALRPVERMRRESEAISGSEPSRRLEVPATRDELAELGASLNRMLDRLEAALVRERRFVDDASHELRTPLANLKVELELALRRSRTPEELEAAVRSAAVETDRLASLAEDLLVLARAADGRLPVRRQETELGPLVGDVARSFAGRAEARGIALVTIVHRDGTARVDEARVRQAVGNLIENALGHTPSGGRITVGVTRSDGTASIAVTDTGEGFPDGFIDRAFEAFTRADAARSPDGGGTGLGLAIVRVVAEGHGGSVAARNNPEGGATVELTLPV